MITYRPKGQQHRLDLSRPWTHLIKLPGLRGTPKINVKCYANESKCLLVTPRRVRIKANINLSTDEINLVESGKSITWRHLPTHIARSTSHLSFEHILHVPETMPSVRKIISSEFRTVIERVTTLRDRLIIKGTANIVITYSDS